MVNVIARSVAPAQVGTANALGRVSVGVTDSGVVLGRDSAGRPVTARLFGPRPVSVVFLGGWWAAQVLVHRCLAHGAAVVVEALDPAPPTTTAALAQWLALDPGRVRPLAGDAAVAWPASVSQPLLRIVDTPGGAAIPGAPARLPLQAWHTQLTMLSSLDLTTVRLLARADLAIIQRLEPAEAALVGSALLLSPEFVARFGAMDNEMIAAFQGPATRYVWLTPTAIERQLFG